MTKKVILSTALGFIFMLGVQAQEKKTKITDTSVDKTMQIKKADPPIKNPKANVNFEQVQDTRTLGQDEVKVKSLKFDGMVVGEKRSSIPLKISETRKVQIQFKTDNPNALYYLVDRLDNIVIPATEKPFHEELRAGEYFLMVGLTTDAIKEKQKATYSFVIK